MSQGVIVIETKSDGGTMHTARFAMQQGRLLGVMAPPEKYINDDHYSGNMQLLKEAEAHEIKDSKSIEDFVEKKNSSEKRG